MQRDIPLVRLVGAGPGPADLMTVRAVRAVEQAQALLYDALVANEVLALAPPACLRIQTGKRAGKASMRQETINRLMLRLARRGLAVVRLKGGDPSIFGRCGEEREFLEAHGVEVEVVPGVTAASAAAAQFAFPLTHRGEARQVVFATGRLEQGERKDLADFAREDTTLALYMARDGIGDLAAQLMDAGRAPSTPAVAVENAASKDARLFVSDLAGLPSLLSEARPSGPVVVMIGGPVARAQAQSNTVEMASTSSPRVRLSST